MKLMQAFFIHNQASSHVIARTMVDIMHHAALIFCPTYEHQSTLALLRHWRFVVS